MSARRVPWEEPPTLAGRGLKGLTLAVVLLFVGFPLYVVVLTSLSPQRAVTEAGGLVVVPDGLTMGAYQEILTGGVVTRAVLVSLGVTLVGTALSVVVSVLAAYGLSQLGSFGHRPLLFTLLITLFFGAGIIPNYLVVKGLGMIDTYWALILPSAVSVFNILVMRTFFMNLPAELLDSARVDGAGDVRILLRIVLPLSKAVTAVVALFYAVGYWNAFFNVMLYMPTDSAKWPLQYVLLTFVNRGNGLPGSVNSGFGSTHAQTAPLSLQMAVVVLTLVPLLIVYPFVQKHFRTGVLTGAIKG